MQLITFNQLSRFEFKKGSGIYAWYYNITLGDADIHKIIEVVKTNPSSYSKIKVNEFLERHIYQFFKESNYNALISGKLMPTFKGELQHDSQISMAVADEIILDPEILWDIKDFFSNLNVNFSSPIYIGMAKNLGTRVQNHKRLIERFRTEKIMNDDFDDRDENFAARVVSRKMLTKNLSVSVQYIESDKQIQSTLENIMNRINYPVLGRN